MKFTKIVFAVFILGITFFTGAQTVQNNSDQPFIEVTGTKELEIVPDEIYIWIVIRERMEDRVKITIEEQEVKLKESITALGIDLTNLTLSDANADYMRIKWKTKDVILQKNYTLKVKDAATVGKVYLEMDKLNIRDAFIEKVTHSKIEAYKKEVRIGAIKDAKDKADYLLNAIGESTGKPLVVVDQLNEIQPNHFSQYGYAKLDEISSYDKNYGGSMGTDVVQFSKIKIKMNIYVKFGIK